MSQRGVWGVPEGGGKKGYDDLLSSWCGRAFVGIELFKTAVGNEALFTCIVSLSEQMGYLFQMLKLVQGAKKR